MIYFDSDMSKSTNTVVYFDWKTVIYIYAFVENVAHHLCCQIRADDNSSTCTFTTEKSVTLTGACANEIIPSINRSFVYKAKEGRHVRIYNNIKFLIFKNPIFILSKTCNVWAMSHRGNSSV
jgi:hypothetical protein